MPSLDHAHTYVTYKSRSGPNWKNVLKEKWFRCDNPGCTHFAPYEMVIGKRASCSSCGTEYILDRKAATRVKPRCLACSNTKAGRASQAAAKAMALLLEPVVPHMEDLRDADD